MAEGQSKNDVGAYNSYDFQRLLNKNALAAEEINGKSTGINERSDVFERGAMSMMGIKNISGDYPASVQISSSEKERGMMIMDIQGMKDEDVSKFTKALNEKYGAGTAVDVGAYTDKRQGTKFEHSLMIPIETAEKISKDLRGSIDTIAQENPELIRALQRQSNHPGSFIGANEKTPTHHSEPSGKSGASSGEITADAGAAGGIPDLKMKEITLILKMKEAMHPNDSASEGLRKADSDLAVLKEALPAERLNAIIADPGNLGKMQKEIHHDLSEYADKLIVKGDLEKAQSVLQLDKQIEFAAFSRAFEKSPDKGPDRSDAGPNHGLSQRAEIKQQENGRQV